MEQLFSGFLAVLAIALVIAVWRKRRRHVGAASAGTFYEILSDDKRAALEIIVQDRAGYRDPEDRDGDLPQLETPSEAPTKK